DPGHGDRRIAGAPDLDLSLGGASGKAAGEHDSLLHGKAGHALVSPAALDLALDEDVRGCLPFRLAEVVHGDDIAALQFRREVAGDVGNLAAPLQHDALS